ncbi:hypothetical protein AB0P05_23245 [Streptomyces flaveolus]|uniref:hypothetical protein n=1 Tax=Streptomyces flaveolus TaxID=67297 RepID=UPI003439190B
MTRDRILACAVSLALAVPLVALGQGTASAATDYQAEDARVSQGAVATNHTGYTGSGFVDYTNVKGRRTSATAPRTNST